MHAACMRLQPCIMQPRSHAAAVTQPSRAAAQPCSHATIPCACIVGGDSIFGWHGRGSCWSRCCCWTAVADSGAAERRRHG